MTAAIRMATVRDAGPVLGIYGPIVRDTAISFEVDPPDEEEMRRRIAEVTKRFPWLVCERSGDLLGYAYAGPHRDRAAYRWSVDVAVYIDPAARRQGVARALYASLSRLLALQGYFNAYAGITISNPGSIALHERIGFRRIGVYTEVGYKHGRWHDVGWWHLELAPKPREPRPPVPIGEIRGSRDWSEALEAGRVLLREPR